MDLNRYGVVRQVLAFTAACMVASVVIMAGVTWLVTGTLNLGLGVFIAILVPAVVVPIGSYWHISLAARLAHANARLRALSETDPLTGTFNRRRFLEVAQQQLVLARRHGLPTSVLIIDFDHFKAVNDRFGHGAGDDVLVRATARIQATLRESDTLARFGGEEFIVLLPHTTSEGARMAAERILATVRLQRIHHHGEPIAVTVSIGAITSDGGDAPLETLISSADALLYQAKQAGRDHCRLGTLTSDGARAAAPSQTARAAPGIFDPR